MSFLDILSSLTEQVTDQPASRRDALAKSADLARKMALAALPLGLATVANPAKAGALNTDALNLMLEFKLLLKDLYTQGANSNFPASASGTISAADVKKVITEVQPQIDNQITAITDAITNAGSTPVTRTFTFPAAAFTDRKVFMSIAQVLHDVSSGAIKGILPAFDNSVENLMLAIKTETLDARYANLWAIGRNTTSAQFYPQDGTTYTDLPQALTDFGNAEGVNIAQTAYQGENNTVQAGTDVMPLVSQEANAFVAGAFDEPLPETEARRILDLFIV